MPPPAAEAAPAAPSRGPRPPAKPDVLPPPRATGEFNVLCYTLLSLFLVSFGVWAVFAWIDYGKRYAPTGEGWYAGGTRSIEITLVREDRENLDCYWPRAVLGFIVLAAAWAIYFAPAWGEFPLTLEEANRRLIFLPWRP